MFTEKRIEELLILARDNEGAGNAKLASCILDRNKVIAYGFNKYKTHPLQAKFGRNAHSICLHSEIDAIVNANRINENLQGKTMIVARTLKNGERALAAPCSGCIAAMEEYGFKRVIFTTEKGYETWVF